LLAVVSCALASYEDDWEAFKLKYNKQYAAEDETFRFNIYIKNRELAAAMNAKAPNTEFGETKFSDLTPEEFRLTYLSKYAAEPDATLPVAPLYSPEHIQDLPSSFDWTTKGAVTPVKNQGQCGSCWSFSATGNVEGQWFLAGHNLTGLSEQNLVDCDHECMIYEGEKSCDSGCSGGLQPNAFTYIIKTGGIDTESSYPYEGVDGQCRFSSNNVGATISNFTAVSSDEDQMAAYLVEHGPLAIAADAAEWQFYIGGVFDFPCGKTLDHGILITGYGVETDIWGKQLPYWIVKNSWGADWGKDGYLWIVRGKGECGLNTFVYSAIV